MNPLILYREENMDKSLFIFILIGVGFLYFITNFVGDIQEEDDRLKNTEYRHKHKYDKYYTTDSVGQEILDLTDATPSVQTDAWNSSPLKEEFLSLYPDFSEMKRFVKDRVRGEYITQKLLSHISDVEDKFFSGKIDSEQAKRLLGKLP
jgi:hypothetical protein